MGSPSATDMPAFTSFATLSRCQNILQTYNKYQVIDLHHLLALGWLVPFLISVMEISNSRGG